MPVTMMNAVHYHLASDGGHVEVARVLEHPGRGDRDTRDKYDCQCNPLERALMEGIVGIVCVLLVHSDYSYLCRQPI